MVSTQTGVGSVGSSGGGLVGGFDDDGTYLSPRTRFRDPAIVAWEEHRVSQFATPILDIPLESWPESFPNVEQSKLLIKRGAPDSIIANCEVHALGLHLLL